MRPILILTGIELEARALARELELPGLRVSGIPVFGRGPVRVAAAGLRAALLDSRWPALLHGMDRPVVVSAGVCGGLAPGLATGDLVLPDRVIGLRGELRRVARCRDIPTARTASGDLITTPHVVATREAKAALFAATNAIAADMESSLIVEAATDAGLTAMVVRGVSDDAHRDVPRELLDLVTPAGRLRAGRAAALLVKPAALRAAIDIRRGTERALRVVAAALAALAASR